MARRLSEKAVAASIRRYQGNLAAVARAHNVSRTAVHQYVHRRPDLKKVMKECRESMLDNVESALQRAATNGEGWATTFYLRTQGRHRGYIVDPDIAQMWESMKRLQKKLRTYTRRKNEKKATPRNRGSRPAD